MSPTADVVEMQSLCGAIADRAAGSHREKDRIGAVDAKLGFGWNRTLEFLRGKARRVDSWEKDHARDVLAALKQLDQQRQDAEHLSWLSRSLAHLEASDEEFYRPEIAALERALGVGRAVRSAVDVPAEPDAGFDQREGWGR